MAGRRLRVVLGVVAALILMVALGLGAAAWLVSSSGGARLVLERVGQVMPGTLELGAVEGPLRGPLRLDGVVYTRNGVRLEIDRLVLRWHLRDLLRRQLDVHEITATGVRLTTTPGEEADAPFEPPQIDLPVNLVVRQASVRDAVIVLGDGEPIRIRSADLTTRSRGETLVIESFDVDSPDIDLDIEGSLTPLGAYDVDLEVAWLYRLPDGRQYGGAGTVGGTLEDLVVRQRLEQPFAAQVEARLLHPLDDLRFEGAVEASAIDLRALDETWPAAVVSADLSASGSLEQLTVRGKLLVRSEEYGAIAADLDVEGGEKTWRIERLRLTTERSEGAVLVGGEVVLDETMRFDLAAEWENLRWPLDASAAQATALAPSGSLRLEGTTADYRVEGSLRLGLPGLLAGGPGAGAGPRGLPSTNGDSVSGAAPVSARAVPGDEPPPTTAEDGPAPERATLWIDATIEAAGDRTGARIERFSGTALGGRVTGEGSLSWEPEVAWNLALAGDALEPGLLESRFAGELDLELRTEGTMTQQGPRGVVTLSQISGTLQGQPVRGQGRVDLEGGAYRIRELDIDWGDTEIRTSGVVGDTLDLRFRLGTPDLRRLFPELAGSIEVEGVVLGTRASPGVRARVTGGSLLLGEFAADSLAGTVLVGSGPQDPLDVSLEAESVRHGERELGSARLVATGSRARHDLEVSLSGGSPPLHRVEIDARGGLDQKQWSGRLDRLVFAPEETEVWRLASPAEVSAGAELVRLDRICLTSEGQRICASGAWQGAEAWSVEASASDLSLETVARFYREGLDLEGTLDATLRGEAAAGGAVRGNVVVTSERGSFVVPGETELAGRRGYRDAQLRVVAGASGTRADAEIELVDVGDVEGFVELPSWSGLGMPPPEQPVRGSIVAHASSLEPLVLLSDAFARPRGRLDADFDVTGTVGEPLVRGSARLAGASAFVVPLGITVEDVEVTAEPSGSESGELVVVGSLRSGEGTLEIRGSAPLEPRDVMARIELSGENVLVMDMPDRRVVASTDELTVVWTTERIEAFGEVRIPEAQIQLGEDDPDAVTPSADVVFVRLPPGSEREPSDEIGLEARVRLVLGEDVLVTGLGLEAEVRGSLLVVERPGSVTRATGELDLAGGTFAAYGARLEIERGRLIFADSPVTSPAIDLRASRRARDVVAGIEASGTLQQPRVTLWSEPPMPQAEQLSYLVLGRPLGEAGSGEGDLLTRAAQSLGLRGGRYLAERLGSLFGLEEARIETGEGGFDSASLVLGKFLSPRLYMAYGVGLFDEGTNSLLLRYLLSKNLTLEALTGEKSRADVLYVIETGPGEPRPNLRPQLPEIGDDR